MYVLKNLHFCVLKSLLQGENATPGYEWAYRHTWQSWRNRYKHHKDRIDKMSEEYRRENNIVPGQKGQYAFVHKRKTPMTKKVESDDDSNSSDDKPRSKKTKATRAEETTKKVR